MRKLPFVFRYQILVLLPLLLPAISSAATYIKPDPTEELFKLEKIPLQVDRMKELSKHLVVLSKRQHRGETTQHRSTAQMLALALRLDPSNQEVRDINQNLADGNKLEVADERSISNAKARIRFFMRWLAQPDAGSDANKLSDYLGDATKVLAPESLGNKDLGDWNNVIPPLEEYPQDKIPKRKRQPMDKDRDDTEHLDDPFENAPAANISKFHITDLSVNAPYILDKRIKDIDRHDDGRVRTSYKTIHTISEVSIQIRPWREGDESHLQIDYISRKRDRNVYERDPIYRGTAAVLYELLVTRHKNLGQYKTRVSISEGLYAQSNHLALTAPLALMLESSATNKPLRDDLHVCGSIDGKGKFYMHENFWTSLKILRESKAGGRLIVPKGASQLLSQVLVFETPDFFTRWQVFAVDTLDEAMAVSTKSISGELAEADQLFESIQQLTPKTSVPKLAANKIVRTRLMEISKKSPTHLSSRILLLQGSTKRPRYFSAETLAHTVMPAVTLMHYTLDDGNPRYPSYKKMLKTHEEARAILDPLVRMVDRSNGQLYKSSVDLANDFRSLSLLIRRMQDRDDYSDATSRKIRSNYTRMATKAKELLKKCRKDSGFAEKED